MGCLPLDLKCSDTGKWIGVGGPGISRMVARAEIRKRCVPFRGGVFRRRQVQRSTKQPAPIVNSSPSTAPRLVDRDHGVDHRAPVLLQPAMWTLRGPSLNRNSPTWRTKSTTLPPWIKFLLGRPAMFGQEPPIKARSHVLIGLSIRHPSPMQRRLSSWHSRCRETPRGRRSPRAS